MLTALLLVASFAVAPAPAQDLGFAGWLAHEGGLPRSSPAVTCTSCTTCAAMHRSCCFSSASQCTYCVPFGLKCT
ncbi:MAG: hypothetical protein QOJ16_827 [Acidobacteriota bacterium]|nr:hypothetical protein [Acidobacteriota bacterium]